MEYQFLIDTYETERMKHLASGLCLKMRMCVYVQMIGAEETPLSIII